MWGRHGAGRDRAERSRPTTLSPLPQGTTLTAQHVIWVKWAPPLEQGRLTSMSISGEASDATGVTATSREPGTRRALETALPAPPLRREGATWGADSPKQQKRE